MTIPAMNNITPRLNLIVIIIADAPKQPDHYKKMIPDNIGLVHTTIEIHKCNSMMIQ